MQIIIVAYEASCAQSVFPAPSLLTAYVATSLGEGTIRAPRANEQQLTEHVQRAGVSTRQLLLMYTTPPRKYHEYKYVTSIV